MPQRKRQKTEKSDQDHAGGNSPTGVTTEMTGGQAFLAQQATTATPQAQVQQPLAASMPEAFNSQMHLDGVAPPDPDAVTLNALTAAHQKKDWGGVTRSLLKANLTPKLSGHDDVRQARLDLAQAETEKGVYYGSDTDTDSDSEYAPNFVKGADPIPLRKRSEMQGFRRLGGYKRARVAGQSEEKGGKAQQAEAEQEDYQSAPAPVPTKADHALLAKLNEAIKQPGFQQTKEFDRFVVPQFRGISYMTNRFSKQGRRKHRLESQTGKKVYSDAARPPGMSRENFYNTAHGPNSEVAKREQSIKGWVASKKQYDPIYDPQRGHIFTTPYHWLQSDYSQDYSKSMKLAHDYHGQSSQQNAPPPAQTSSTTTTSSLGTRAARDELRSQNEAKVYAGIPAGSHVLVSTADQPEHAVRYALGNKPIAAEKDFRLRPRWQQSGKAQHPYSGKVYTSFHPVSEYLGPDAPSHVHSGRTEGAYMIDNDISKEGESSFPASIEGEHVHLEKTARWPSFKRKWSKAHEVKFGLGKAEYAKYQDILKNNAPHSDARKALKKDKLGKRLEDVYSNQIHEQVGQWAADNNKLIVYRSLDGGFSFDPANYDAPDKTRVNQWKVKPTAQQKSEKNKLENRLRSKIDTLERNQPRYGHRAEGYGHMYRRSQQPTSVPAQPQTVTQAQTTTETQTMKSGGEQPAEKAAVQEPKPMNEDSDEPQT